MRTLALSLLISSAVVCLWALAGTIVMIRTANKIRK